MFKQWLDVFPREFEFSLAAKFRDLLTSDDVIGVLICILSAEFYTVLHYKHFKVWHVVPWFTILKTMAIFPYPLNYRPVWAANDVPYDVISGGYGYEKSTLTFFSVMLHGPLHESEEELRAHVPDSSFHSVRRQISSLNVWFMIKLFHLSLFILGRL